MSDHDSLLNRAAFAYDRWAVGRLDIDKRWHAFAPKGDSVRDGDFPTQPEAFAYADAQARATMPTAAQIDQAEAAQDAELDALVADLAAWDEANVDAKLRERP